MLAMLPAAQVRALFPDRSAFVQRHGAGPTSLSALRSLLTDTRQRGHAVEDGEVTPGFASVATAVLDHNAMPVASVAVTWSSADPPAVAPLVEEVRATADALGRRLRGGTP
jgi:DNA-binding IclR family transcriptional regulator